MQRYLQLGTNFNIVDEYGQTPLNIAIKKNNELIVSYLIEGEVDVNSYDKRGFCPIHLAAINANKKILTLLLKQVSNKNKKIT